MIDPDGGDDSLGNCGRVAAAAAAAAAVETPRDIGIHEYTTK